MPEGHTEDHYHPHGETESQSNSIPHSELRAEMEVESTTPGSQSLTHTIKQLCLLFVFCPVLPHPGLLNSPARAPPIGYHHSFTCPAGLCRHQAVADSLVLFL